MAETFHRDGPAPGTGDRRRFRAPAVAIATSAAITGIAVTWAATTTPVVAAVRAPGSTVPSRAKANPAPAATTTTTDPAVAPPEAAELQQIAQLRQQIDAERQAINTLSARAAAPAPAPSAAPAPAPAPASAPAPAPAAAVPVPAPAPAPPTHATTGASYVP